MGPLTPFSTRENLRRAMTKTYSANVTCQSHALLLGCHPWHHRSAVNAGIMQAALAPTCLANGIFICAKQMRMPSCTVSLSHGHCSHTASVILLLQGLVADPRIYPWNPDHENPKLALCDFSECATGVLMVLKSCLFSPAGSCTYIGLLISCGHLRRFINFVGNWNTH